MAEKVFLKECYIQDTNQYEALDVWNELKISSSLCLTNEDEFGKISKNIFLVFQNSGKCYHIGRLSDEDGKDLEKYIKTGWGDSLYDVRLSYKDESKEDENKRMKVVIFIKSSEYIDNKTQTTNN